MSIWWAFKFAERYAAEYKSVPETNGAGYWRVVAGQLIVTSFPAYVLSAITVQGVWPGNPGIVLLPAIPFLAVVFGIIGGWHHFRRTPVPSFWAKAVIVASLFVLGHAITIGLIVLIIVVSPETLPLAIILFGATCFMVPVLAGAGLLADLLLQRWRRNAKGPAGGEASGSK